MTPIEGADCCEDSHTLRGNLAHQSSDSFNDVSRFLVFLQFPPMSHVTCNASRWDGLGEFVDTVRESATRHRIKSDSATKFPRFRNQISDTLPQPKSEALLQPKKGASATKKKDSATKKGRFRNQNKTIPQTRADDSATKIRAIRKPKSASLCNQDLCFYTLAWHRLQVPHSTWHSLQGGVSLHLRSLLGIRAVTINMASSSDAVGWVGWGGTITSLQLRSFL